MNLFLPCTKPLLFAGSSFMRVFCFVLFVCSFIQTNAQVSSKPTYTFTPRVHYGYIWNFSKEVSHLANQHMPAIELDVTKQTNGTKAWQQEYRYPQIGYSLMYYVFDPQKPVGNALALFLHAGKNFYKTKRSNFQWRLGYGLAYVERRFEVKTNYRNNVLSQRLNFTISGQLNFNLRLSSAVLFNLGIGLLHISNGSLKKPNFGINLPSLHAGIGMDLFKGDERYKKDSIVSVYKRKTYFHVSPFAGLKEVYPVNGPKYVLGGVTAYLERRMNRKSGLHAGFDFSYDHSKKSEIRYDTLDVANTAANRAQGAVVLGHELYLHRLSLLTQAGIYLYDPTHINKSIYQKVGLKYYVSEKLFVHMTMKLHLGIADWIEWGGGIRI